MELPFIETERLRIRLLSMDHLKIMYETLSKFDFIKALGLIDESEYQIEVDRYNGGYNSYNRTSIRFLAERKTDRRIVAHAALHNWFITHRRAEIGYNVKYEEDRLKGYMFETVTAVLNYGFRELMLNRIEATTSPDNLGSRRILEKSGFREEGLMRKHYFTEGEFIDSLLYGLLAEDYLSK